MIEIVDFLLARIGEDWVDAVTGDRWKSLPPGEYGRLQARVLAECAAKRQIVHAATWARKDGTRVPMELDQPILKILAAVYAAHRDYRVEWCP
ncbi:MAG: DUF6221 family protein [Motilibacteraceae bacterium]